MAITTTSEVTAAVNYFYDRKLLRKAVPRFVYQRWAQIRDLPRNSAESIRFRRYTLLGSKTTPLSEGITPSCSQLAITNVNATPEQYGRSIIAVLKSFLTFNLVLSN